MAASNIAGNGAELPLKTFLLVVCSCSSGQLWPVKISIRTTHTEMFNKTYLACNSNARDESGFCIFFPSRWGRREILGKSKWRPFEGAAEKAWERYRSACLRGWQNEDTLWWQHCWRDHVSQMLTHFATHATFLSDTNLCSGHMKCFWKSSAHNSVATFCHGQATSQDTMLPLQCVPVLPGPYSCMDNKLCGQIFW